MNIQNRTRHFGIKYKKIIELPTIETQGKLIKILDKTNLILEKQEQSRLLATKLFSSVFKNPTLVDGLEL